MSRHAPTLDPRPAEAATWMHQPRHKQHAQMHVEHVPAEPALHADGRLTTHHAMQGAFKYHQYQVVGRHLPTEHNENPELYRMKLWASDTVAAKSKFWCATTPPPNSHAPACMAASSPSSTPIARPPLLQLRSL